MHRNVVALGVLAVVLSAGRVQAAGQPQGPGTPVRRIAFVAPQWAASHYDDRGVKVLDARELKDYLAGHIPGAVHFDPQALRGPSDGVPAQLLSDDLLAMELRRAGISRDDRVLIYSDGEVLANATLIAYALERIGHGDVAVLDGGFSAYRKVPKAKTTRAYPRYETGALNLRATLSSIASAADVERALRRKGVVFIDARPAKLFTGEVEMFMRNGHIPGAINLPISELVDPADDGRLKPVAALQAMLKEKGVEATREIIVYCNTAREASFEYAVLRHVLGFPNVRLYEGSWVEYSALKDLPVEKGPVVKQ